MKRERIIFSLIITVLFFSVCAFCNKDAALPSNRILGLWTGKYLVNGSSTSSYYSFVIKPGGKLIVDSKAGSQQHISTGTWKLSGTTLTCTYTCIYGSEGSIGLLQTSSTTWDKQDKLSGTWKNVNGVKAEGTLMLEKIK
jgi:hypothetical protein